MGDEVWAMTFDEYVDEDQDPSGLSFNSPLLTNRRMVKTTIQGILPSIKEQTVYYNNDTSKRFSLEEKILIKRDGMFGFIGSGNIEVGDIYVNQNADGSFSDLEITAVDIINEDRTVYRFNAEPIDHLIAGNMVVHNRKSS